MRRVLGPLLRFSLAAPLLVSIAMAGCAAAHPPAVPVQDLKMMKGEPEGVLPLVKVRGR